METQKKIKLDEMSLNDLLVLNEAIDIAMASVQNNVILMEVDGHKNTRVHKDLGHLNDKKMHVERKIYEKVEECFKEIE